MSTSHFHTSSMANYPPGSEQSRPRSRPRLGFQEAMENFSTMFPTMDRSIIEAVLRSCNGHIQQTIDKLLVMTTDATPTDDTGSHLDRQHPQSVVMLDGQQNVSNSVNDDRRLMQNNDASSLSTNQSIANNNQNNSQRHNTHLSTTKYRPPLVGRLPDDFLRITPARTITSSSHHMRTYDPIALQMMEDERLAKWLQNEEFMRHLQSNEDFVRSLESEHNHGSRRSRRPNNIHHNNNNNDRVPQQSPAPVDEGARRSEDGATGGRDEEESYNKKKLSTAEFREKLKTMGSSTREKFYHLANKFNRKKKPNSSRQLLLDCDEYDTIPDQSDMDYGATEAADSQDYISYNDSSSRHVASNHPVASSKQLNNQMDQKHAINNANSTASNVIDPATGRTLEPTDPFMARR